MEVDISYENRNDNEINNQYKYSYISSQ